MNTYTYIDYKKKGEVIFSTKADNILEADKILKEQKGIDPIKCPHIGCRIEN